MGLLQRIKERRTVKRGLLVKLRQVERNADEEQGKEPRKGRLFGGFFSKERVARRQGRVAKRRDFRVKVSGNRKWMLIGLAVVVVCITIIYLSITYGGGLLKLFT